MSKTKSLLMAGIMLAITGSAGAVNILTNGSFEEPALYNPSFNIFSDIPGWAGTNCGIEVQNHVAGDPFEGAQHVELDSNCPSAMIQSVATTDGEVYRLVYHYSPRPGVGNNRIKVKWDGEPVEVLQTSGNGKSETAWEEHIHLVQATSNSTDLKFKDISPDDGVGGYIDDVILEPLDTPDMICKAVRDVVDLNIIAMGLCAKLNSIEFGYTMGATDDIISGLKDAFAFTVATQTPSHISEEDAELLIAAVYNLPPGIIFP